MFLQFGSRVNKTYEQPRLLWTDGQDVSYTLELLDISSIRQPALYELESYYPFSIPANSFFVSTNGGTSLLFEAVDDVQMRRITSALQGIVARLAKKIVMGEQDWVCQMMLSSAGGESGQISSMNELEEMVPNAMADVTDHLVKKTTLVHEKTKLMQQAHERRNRLRSRR